MGERFGVRVGVMLGGVMWSALAWAGEPEPGEPFEASPNEWVVFAKSRLAQRPARVEGLVTPKTPLVTALRFVVGDDGSTQMRYHGAFTTSPGDSPPTYSTIRMAYMPWMETRPEIKARLILPDGTEKWLDPATFVEGPAGGAANGMVVQGRAITAPIPPVPLGTIVEYTTTKSFKGTYDTSGFSHRVRPGPSDHGALSRFVLDVPVDSPLHLKQTLPKAQLTDRRSKGRRIVEVNYAHIDTGEATNGWIRPPRDPGPGMFAFSTSSDWKAVTRAYLDRIENTLDADAGEALIAGLELPKDRRGRVSAIVQRLHERVRYTGLHFGAQAVIPWAPAKVLDRGYGDCKDKAVLLHLALQEAGVGSSLVLVEASAERQHSLLPGLVGFNHMIVRVDGDDPIWVDPTVDVAQLGVLSTVVQGRPALVLDRSTRDLSWTPTQTLDETRFELTTVLNFPPVGPARLEQSAQGRGWLMLPYRAGVEQQLAAINGGEGQRLAEQNGWGAPMRAKLEGNPRDPSSSIRWTTSTEAHSQTARGLGVELTVGFGDVTGGLPRWVSTPALDNPPPHDIGFLPVYLSEVQELYTDPALVPVVSTPINVTLGPLKMERTIETVEPGHTRVRSSLTVDADRIRPEHVMGWVDAMRQLEARKAFRIRLSNPSFALVASGKPCSGGERLYQDSVRLPKSQLLTTYRSTAAASCGFVTDAKALAEASQTQHPTWIGPVVARNQALMTDVYGRVHSPGQKRATMLGALQKTVSTDTVHTDHSLSQLGAVLSRNAQGVRYGAGADLAGAEDAYAASVALRRDAPELWALTHLRLVRGNDAAILSETTDADPILTQSLRVIAMARQYDLGSALRLARSLSGQPGSHTILPGAAAHSAALGEDELARAFWQALSADEQGGWLQVKGFVEGVSNPNGSRGLGARTMDLLAALARDPSASSAGAWMHPSLLDRLKAEPRLLATLDVNGVNMMVPGSQARAETLARRAWTIVDVQQVAPELSRVRIQGPGESKTGTLWWVGAQSRARLAALSAVPRTELALMAELGRTGKMDAFHALVQDKVIKDGAPIWPLSLNTVRWVRASVPLNARQAQMAADLIDPSPEGDQRLRTLANELDASTRGGQNLIATIAFHLDARRQWASSVALWQRRVDHGSDAEKDWDRTKAAIGYLRSGQVDKAEALLNAVSPDHLDKVPDAPRCDVIGLKKGMGARADCVNAWAQKMNLAPSAAGHRIVASLIVPATTVAALQTARAELAQHLDGNPANLAALALAEALHGDLDTAMRLWQTHHDTYVDLDPYAFDHWHGVRGAMAARMGLMDTARAHFERWQAEQPHLDLTPLTEPILAGAARD
ncbi:MAG: DUF3857 domain-containing protein [Myxococcota bacterium]